jgi:hypothetical protein
VGISFNEHAKLTETSEMEFPTKWNRKLYREHVQKTKVSFVFVSLIPATLDITVADFYSIGGLAIDSQSSSTRAEN